MFTLTCHEDETKKTMLGGEERRGVTANKGKKIEKTSGGQDAERKLFFRLLNFFFFFFRAATRLVQKGGDCAAGAVGLERKTGRENMRTQTNAAEDEPSGRISAASTIIRDLGGSARLCYS